jgi:hypothetical protein
LKRNILCIGTTGTETRFLAEGELPECGRLSGNNAEDEDKLLGQSMREAEDHELAKALERSSQETVVAGPSNAPDVPQPGKWKIPFLEGRSCTFLSFQRFCSPRSSS